MVYAQINQQSSYLDVYGGHEQLLLPFMILLRTFSLKSDLFGTERIREPEV